MSGIVASIKDRLLNLSRSTGRDFQMLLERFAMGRLLWRLSRSEKRFVLKGAQLFSVWQETPHRPTRDLDLLSYGEPSLEAMQAFFEQVLAAEAEPDDGLIWGPVSASRIREDELYEGVRIEVIGLLQRTRIPLQIDIGFGDAITPEPVEHVWRDLLGYPEARLLTYPPETVIAEKMNAAVTLGQQNSRMKDFFDLDWLCRHMEFDLPTLHRALKATFANRGTAWPEETPLALTAVFGEDRSKQTQWASFLRKSRIAADPLPVIIGRLHGFLHPVLFSKAENFAMRWNPAAGWLPSI